MASRRSRLKAVANLPIRRKPLSVQQENETPAPQHESKRESCKKERDDSYSNENEKFCKSIEDNQISIDSVSSPKDVSTENQVESDNEKVVPSAEKLSRTGNDQQISDLMIDSHSQFGRQVNPSVSLSVLRERPQRNDKPKTGSIESTNVDEQKSSENGNTSTNVPDNSLSESLIDLNILTEERTIAKVSEPVLSDTTVDKSEESVSTRCSYVYNENNMHQTELSVPENDDMENSNRISVQSPVNHINRQIISQYGLTSDGSVQGNQETSSKEGSAILPGSNKNFTVPLSWSVASQNNVQYNARKGSSIVKQKKVKFNDFARKVADARREFQRKYEKIPPDRSSLRMIDLIFYNPSTNPMESKSKFEKKDMHPNEEELLNEGGVDDPDPLDKSSEISADDDLRNEDLGKMPVPQVKIGLNGEIILDEKSLVIETTDAKKGREDLQNSAPVFEDRGTKTCYYKRKTQKSRDWSDIETKRFYKALNTIGTDFSLMQKYFPLRTRLELKNKFKREEKLNRSLVDKALNNPSEFDVVQFEKYLAMEKQVEDEENGKRVQRKVGRVKRSDHINIRTKSSLLAKEMTEADGDSDLQCLPREDQIKMKLNDKAKKFNDNDLLIEKYSLRENTQHDGATEATTAVVEGGSDSTSNLLKKVDVNKLTKIRDAFDEIQNVNNSEDRNIRGIQTDAIEYDKSETDKEGGTDVVDEFYQAVVSLSASLKSTAEGKTSRTGKRGNRIKPIIKRGEKRKATSQGGRKNAKKDKEGSFVSTLDIETYDSKSYDSNSSNESNDNSFTSTKSISGQDFINLLAANAKNMTESKIQFQITEDCSLEKKVEIILDSVPSIALSEI